jgi:glycosyltransferase involved in cell wall biosynthesis
MRLEREGVSKERVRTFPWIHVPWMIAGRYGLMPQPLSGWLAIRNIQMFDAWAARNMEDCDAFVAISGSGLAAGKVAQGRGAKYVCDRGSSHIRFQQTIVEDEYARWGFQRRIDPRAIAREEAEYQQADAITVPSEFSRRTFVEMGINPARIRKFPLGVRLDRFTRTGEPSAEGFDVLFAGTVSIRKGIPYLLQAFSQFKHPRKRLRLAGPVEPEMRFLLRRFNLENVEILGSMPQEKLARWMSTSHAVVLPSVEDGFGLVMAQSMASGGVVIASEHTGGADLFEHGSEGFIVPIRSPEAICARLTEMAGDSLLRQRMSEAALKRVQGLGGWKDYGERYAAFLKELTGVD